MPQYFTKYDKAHRLNDIAFDALSTITFAPVNVPSGTANSTVLQVLSVPQDMKVMHVSATCTGLSAAGTPTFQVVSGNAAVGAVGTPNVANVNGTPVFSAQQNVPAANTQAVYNASVSDAVCDKTLPLTLRATTVSGDTVTNLQVSLAVVPVDPSPASAPSGGGNNAAPSNF